jgi:hypothetical protein
MLSLLRSRWTLVALFVIGCALMLPFEYWFTRLGGMTLLFAFIIVGVFQIAEPGFLRGDEDIGAADGDQRTAAGTSGEEPAG